MLVFAAKIFYANKLRARAIQRAEQSSTRSNNNSENTSVNISSSLPPCSLRYKKNNAYKELAGSWLGLLPRRSNLVRMNVGMARQVSYNFCYRHALGIHCTIEESNSVGSLRAYLHLLVKL
jgi:hypothetical protein